MLETSFQESFPPFPGSTPGASNLVPRAFPSNNGWGPFFEGKALGTRLGSEVSMPVKLNLSWDILFAFRKLLLHSFLQ